MDYLEDNWAINIPHLVLPARLVPLSLDQLELMAKLHRDLSRRYWIALKQMLKRNEDGMPLGEDCWLDQVQLTQGESQLMQGLLQKINIQGPSFVKMSLRSAKDSFALRKNQVALIEKGLHDLDRKRLQLMVQDSKSGLQQLVTSERVAKDIACRKDKMSIVVRPWQLIPISLQFRTFVSGGKLIGVSAYHTQHFFQFRERHEELIVREVSTLSEQVIGRVSLTHFVCDVGFVLNSKQLLLQQSQVESLLMKGQFQTKLIQINPFGRESDACLFRWSELQHSQAGLAMRLNPPQ